MNLTLGGWFTLIIGSVVLYGGLFICLRIALKKEANLPTDHEPDETDTR